MLRKFHSSYYYSPWKYTFILETTFYSDFQCILPDLYINILCISVSHFSDISISHPPRMKDLKYLLIFVTNQNELSKFTICPCWNILLTLTKCDTVLQKIRLGSKPRCYYHVKNIYFNMLIFMITKSGQTIII